MQKNVLSRIRDLDSGEEQRVKKKLRQAAENPDYYLKPLAGRSDYSLRIGNYRVIVDWDKNDDVIYVTYFGKRDSIYD
ncbi:MAG: type II toxin-antitoxin system RelE/ParE family toxin [Halobacteria archaeon]